jgi:hypothetical protein
MRLDLPDVALLCCDTRDARLALESMHRSIEKIAFGECIYVTCQATLDELPQDFQIDPSIKIKIIDPFASIFDYSKYVLKDAFLVSSKPYFLFVQWDSWVLSAESWTAEFLECDYIGAVWSHHSDRRVGNGGFSLRSRRLMRAVATIAARVSEDSLEIEDDFICRVSRVELESQHNCRFASEQIANLFSAERQGWSGVPFGFHGLLNYGRVFEDSELRAKLRAIKPSYFGDRQSFDLTKYLISQRRYEDARYVIKRRVQLSGWSKKNIKLFIGAVLHALLVSKIGTQFFGKPID